MNRDFTKSEAKIFTDFSCFFHSKPQLKASIGSHLRFVEILRQVEYNKITKQHPIGHCPHQKGENNLLGLERQQEILCLLREIHSVTVEELCKRFYASGATIRRDLDRLQKSGLIRRTHGGAVLLEGNAIESPYLVRESENLEAKLSMASSAAALIKNGDTLFLDSSSTVMQICRHLAGLDGITVITNGIKTAMLLAENAKTTVYLAGGQLRKNSRSVVGIAAKEFLEPFYADIAFLSCHGLDPDHGLTEAHEEESQIKRLLIRQARKTVLLCDSSKIGQRFFSLTCGLDAIDTLITEQMPPPQVCERLEQHQIQIIAK